MMRRRPLPRFPGQRHVQMCVRAPSFDDASLCTRVRLARCRMCEGPIVTHFEYVMGEFYTVMHMLAACPTLWRVLAGRPFDLRRPPGGMRVERICHECRRCRRALYAHLARSRPPGGAARALFDGFAARRAAAADEDARARAEVECWYTNVCADADSDAYTDDDSSSSAASPP